MKDQIPVQTSAFRGTKRIASGSLQDIARQVRQILLDHPGAEILVFDDATGRVIDLDLRGSDAEVAARYSDPAALAHAEAASKGPGRPRLGVVAREVTLLPRHWEWLGSQPGGASVALRKLVEHAMKTSVDTDRVRRSRDAAYRFLNTMAGNEPGYEEAIRALFAGDEALFHALTASLPKDVRDHARKLSGGE